MYSLEHPDPSSGLKGIIIVAIVGDNASTNIAALDWLNGKPSDA